MKIRLNKFLVDSRLAASRRKADTLIASGKVRVNKKPVETLATIIDTDRDDVVVGDVNAKIRTEPTEIYLVHKPRGYVSSKRVGKKEKSVYALVPHSQHLAIAGRLDKQSEGLLILTNDGPLVQELTHPSFAHEKVYLMELVYPLTPQQKKELLRGVRLEEGIATFDRLRVQSSRHVEVTIHQGWKRQIRRMVEAVGNRVARLQRIRIGRYSLGTLKSGAYKRIERRPRT